MVALICIEISMVKDSLYKVFHYSCVDIVLTDVLLKNVFALGEDVGRILVQWWLVFCLYCLLRPSCIDLAGITKDGCTGMPCSSSSMSAASMHPGMSFKRVARI